MRLEFQPRHWGVQNCVPWESPPHTHTHTFLTPTPNPRAQIHIPAISGQGSQEVQTPKGGRAPWPSGRRSYKGAVCPKANPHPPACPTGQQVGFAKTLNKNLCFPFIWKRSDNRQEGALSTVPEQQASQGTRTSILQLRPQDDLLGFCNYAAAQARPELFLLKHPLLSAGKACPEQVPQTLAGSSDRCHP